jgi:hypothetical protein
VKSKILKLVLFMMMMPLTAQALPFDLEGATIGLHGLYPNTSTIAADFGTAVVGDGIEFLSGGWSQHNIDLTATTITLAFQGGTGQFDNTAFNGFKLFDATDQLADFASVSFNSGSGYTGSNTPVVSWDADNIWVNFSNKIQAPGSYITFNVATVPEPSTASLLALGLVGIAAVCRRRAV